MTAEVFTKMLEFIADFVAKIVAAFKKLGEILSNAAAGVAGKAE